MDLQSGMGFQEVISTALSSGCGAIIQWLFEAWARDRAEDGQPVSPKTKRRLVLALCVLVPSVLIGLLYLITWQYSWQAHIMAVGVAFVTSQTIHGEQKLLTGKEVRRRERLEAKREIEGGK